MLGAVAFAISKEQTRYYLCGVYLHTREVEGERVLRAVATDGHRMARVQRAAPPGAADAPGVILPERTVTELRALLDAAADDCAAAIAVHGQAERPRILRAEIGWTTVVSKLVDGTYPDYERVIPAANPNALTLDREALQDAVARVLTVTDGKARGVRFEVEPARLSLRSASPERGDALEEIDCTAAAEVTIGFNGGYVQDMAAALAGDTITLRLADPFAPSLWQGEDDGFVGVLMPMRA